MSKPLADFLADGWVIGIGSALAVALILWIFGGIRRIVTKPFVRAWKWTRQWRLTREPKAAAPSAPLDQDVFVRQPRWSITKWTTESHVYSLKNVGGSALHVRMRAEDPRIEIIGSLDWALVGDGDTRRFDVPKLMMDGMIETWFVITCKDSAGNPQAPYRVAIPGLLS